MPSIWLFSLRACLLHLFLATHHSPFKGNTQVCSSTHSQTFQHKGSPLLGSQWSQSKPPDTLQGHSLHLTISMRAICPSTYFIPSYTTRWDKDCSLVIFSSLMTPKATPEFIFFFKEDLDVISSGVNYQHKIVSLCPWTLAQIYGSWEKPPSHKRIIN